MNLQTIIFIGRSGAGKGMQSGLLREYIATHDPETPLLYIETGEHFRNHIKDSGYTWDLARALGETGARQPDFLAVWVWTHLFLEKVRGNEHIVFDGTPRSLGEATMLDTALPFYQRENPVVIYLDVSKEWSAERLRGRGRGDDLKDEVVAERLAWFDRDVIPAIDFYKTHARYQVLQINGEQTPEEVFADIKKGLGFAE